MIEFEGELQEDEFRRGQRAMRSSLHRWLVLLVPASLATVLLTGGWETFLREPLSTLTIGGLFALWLFIPFAQRRVVTKAWRKSPILHQRLTGTLCDEEGISWKSETSQGTVSWNKLVRQKTTSDLLLVYSTPQSAMILPRSWFVDANAWEEAGRLVTRKLPATV
jgi:hypothetical protein